MTQSRYSDATMLNAKFKARLVGIDRALQSTLSNARRIITIAGQRTITLV